MVGQKLVEDLIELGLDPFRPEFGGVDPLQPQAAFGGDLIDQPADLGRVLGLEAANLGEMTHLARIGFGRLTGRRGDRVTDRPFNWLFGQLFWGVFGLYGLT